jgi:hypothetical protein
MLMVPEVLLVPWPRIPMPLVPRRPYIVRRVVAVVAIAIVTVAMTMAAVVMVAPVVHRRNWHGIASDADRRHTQWRCRRNAGGAASREQTTAQGSGNEKAAHSVLLWTFEHTRSAVAAARSGQDCRRPITTLAL